MEIQDAKKEHRMDAPVLRIRWWSTNKEIVYLNTCIVNKNYIKISSN